METNSSSSFLARNEFYIRRLFSLCGLVPVGAYMVVHLVTNSLMLESPAKFQMAVYQIHGLGHALVFVEWAFIFLPIMFHAILGVVIIRGGLPNSGTYNYGSNIRYTLQRATGMIAFAFIFLHVFHMHGWFHFEPWLSAAKSMGGAQFKPYNAGSSVAMALQGSAWPLLYVVGVLSCVFHLSNGIWSAGIRWGIWVSPAAMKRATVGCTIFGTLLGIVSVAAIWAPMAMNKEKIAEAREDENKMRKSRIDSGNLDPKEAEEKSWKEDEKAHASKTDTTGKDTPEPKSSSDNKPNTQPSKTPAS